MADQVELTRLGIWDDVARIGDEFDLMVDVIVNHVSALTALSRLARTR